MSVYINVLVSLAPLQPWLPCCFIPVVVLLSPTTLSHFDCSPCAAGFGCKMRTLDSGIGTIPLPESCSFFSSILHFLPKSSSTPEPSLSPPSVPGSSSKEMSPSPLPRWRMPSSFKDYRHAGVPNSLSNSSMIHIQSVPFPTVAFLQPVQPPCEPIVTSARVCDNQSRLPRPPPGTVKPQTFLQEAKRVGGRNKDGARRFFFPFLFHETFARIDQVIFTCIFLYNTLFCISYITHCIFLTSITLV